MKKILVFVNKSTAYQLETMSQAETMYAKLPNSVIVEQQEDGTYLMLNRTFTEPLNVSNYVAVRNLVDRLF